MNIVALILHTFRELVLKATILILAGISTLILIVTVAGLKTEQTAEGTAISIFGNKSPVVSGDLALAFVRGSEAAAASGLFAGILFGVLATSGLIPDTLEKGTVDLYLSKPLTRGAILAGRACGAGLVMFLNIVYFLGGFWLILGIRVGVWDARFLAAPLVMTAAFLSLYSIVTFLAVLSRSTVIAVLGAFLFQVILVGVLQNREQILYPLSANAIYRGVLDGLFYIFPQTSGLQDTLRSYVIDGSFSWSPFLASAASSCAWYTGAWWLFEKSDY